MIRRSRSLPAVAAAALVALGLVPAVPAAPAAAAAGPEPEHAATRELISLVDDGAALVAEKGPEGACASFREQGSRWLHGETYVFILDLEGKALCHPGRPSIEGRGRIDLHDPHGKPIARNFLRDLERAESGWEHYLWPRPGSGTNFFWKTVYVRRAKGPDGASYVVGSGGYQMPMERFEDPDGKVIGREMLAVLATADAGWVDYRWPRPGDSPTSRKSSYVRKATLPDGRTVVVGAGLYLD